MTLPLAPFVDRPSGNNFCYVSILLCFKYMCFFLFTDNILQFTSSKVTDQYKGLGICHVTSTRGIQKGNGQAEASNKTILQCLKKMLEKKSKWPEEMPRVLWAYLITILKAKGEHHSPWLTKQKPSSQSKSQLCQTCTLKNKPPQKMQGSLRLISTSQRNGENVLKSAQPPINSKSDHITTKALSPEVCKLEIWS